MNDPLSEKHYSLLFLPATPLSPSRALEGLFELTRHWTGSVTTEIQGGHKMSLIVKSQQNRVELVTSF